MKKICIYILISCLFFDVYSQRRKNNKNVNPTTTKEEKISLSALKLRNIGPAFLSGRISDIAIHPIQYDKYLEMFGSGIIGILEYVYCQEIWNLYQVHNQYKMLQYLEILIKS